MKKNLGYTDRLVRLVLSVVFAVLWFQNIVTGIAGIVLLILGCIFILTSVTGVCPLYNLFGISTCAGKKSS
jgi:hypothetical protein